MELGLGIHGEPGARQQPMCSADEAAAQVPFSPQHVLRSLDCCHGYVALCLH